MISGSGSDGVISTFGYHPSGHNGSADRLRRHAKWDRMLGIGEKASLVVAAGAAIVTGGWILPAAWGLVAFASLGAARKVTRLVRHQEVCQTAGILFDKQTALQFQAAKQCKPVKGIVTEHCADTEVWRKELIASAEHNIVVSGNYCEGKSFQEFLDAVERRMNEKPLLKVVVISSPRCLDKATLARIDALTQKYPKSFSLIKSPDIWHISPGVKKSTNHTKCLVIDYGKYFILGGSGIQDTFSGTGLEDLSREEFLKSNPLHPQEDTNSNSTATVPSGHWLGSALPKEFRDMDFVFCSKHKSAAGKQVYRQMLLLAYRWEQYQKLEQGESPTSPLEVGDLGVFTGKMAHYHDTETLTEQLLKTPIPAWHRISTRVTSFDESCKKATKVQFRLLASGPEQTRSSFALELISQFDRAKRQITINHMYFHPSQEVMGALVRAAKRGVQVTIITCGAFRNGPISHQVFGPRNKYHYADLSRLLSDDERSRLEVYEFRQGKKGSHKKVIVVDDTVVAGSSNFGYKSLVTTSDHELNFICTSSDFAKKTLEICALDIAHSQHMDHTTAPTTQERVRAQLHKLAAPLIG